MIKSKSGFTLLELLVVVGILAALVALALPFYQDYVNQSKLTAAEADLQTFKKALAMYDQLEPAMFTGSDLRTLIGKYLQDYRTYSGQENPVDPWGNDYQIDDQEGVLYSYGPDGSPNTTTTDRRAGGDDILVTWKPPFILASAKAVNNTTIEISFSRKVADLSGPATNFATILPAATGDIQKVSATVYRFRLSAPLVPGNTYSVTIVNNSVAAQDGKPNFNVRPEDDSPGGVASFAY